MLYLVLFVAAAVISTSLLLFAIVLFVGDLLGSLVLSLLLIGVVMATIALVIYRGQLRPMFRAVSLQMQTIYEVASVAQSGYNWVLDTIERFIHRV